MARKRSGAGLAAGLLLSLAGGTALAQSAGSPSGSGPAVPERIEPPRPTPVPAPGSAGGTSSNGVARGVVPPPLGLDPGIQAPVPEPRPNTTPVIPPPGTLGENPAVQPR